MRIRFALGASLALWLGALIAWATDGDTRLFLRLDAEPVLAAMRPCFEFYSDWGMLVFYVPFLALLLHGTHRKNRLTRAIGFAYVFAQLFGTVLLLHLIKIGLARPRPHSGCLHDAVCQVVGLAQAMHSSFPSSHTVDAAVGAFFALLLLRSRAASTLALAAALLMAVSRIALGKHYLSDVLAGLALGAGIAGVAMQVYLLPRWLKIESDQP